jgi:hypothetical protein
MPPRAVRSAGGGMGGRYLWTHRVNRRGWGSGGRGFGQLRFLKRQLAVLDDNVDAIGIPCSPLAQIRPTECHRLCRIGGRLR